MDKQEFNQLIAQWCMGTSHLSSTSAIMRHSSVYLLVQAGREIVPWIIDEYRRDSSIRWGLILYTILNVTPYGKEKCGCVDDMKNAWLEWWEDHKHTGSIPL